jgi:hypothetical protein
MRCARLPAPLVAALALLPVAISACTMPMGGRPAPEPVALPAALPPSFPPEELVGRWGLAAYHKDADRARTEAAARGHCKQPYVIGRGAGGGVIMHMADTAQPEELRVKGGPDGKNYIGPDPDPGNKRDREVVSFDGRVLQLRWLDPEVAGRYGTMVYVRCGPKA